MKIIKGTELKIRGEWGRWRTVYAAETFNPEETNRYPLAIIREGLAVEDFNPLATKVTLKFKDEKGKEIKIKRGE